MLLLFHFYLPQLTSVQTQLHYTNNMYCMHTHTVQYVKLTHEESSNIGTVVIS